MHLDSGFILSTETVDSPLGVSFVIWLLTEKGPLKAISLPESVVFFIKLKDKATVEKVLRLSDVSFEIVPVELKDFQQGTVAGCYFKSLKHYYNALKALSAEGIVTYEDDIRPIDRFLMERFIKGSTWVRGDITHKDGYRLLTNCQFKNNPDVNPKFKTVSLDIECNGEGVLFSIGLVGHGIDCVLMIGSPIKYSDAIEIIWCVDEIDLLQKLQHFIAKTDPDLIIGWNVIEFDFSVLHSRAETLGIELRLGRNNEKIKLRVGHYTRLTIPGRVVIDGIDTLKNATYHYDSFSLSNVAAKELGEKKFISSSDQLAEIERQFNDDKLSLAKYNRQDCVLVLRIFNKLNLLDFAVVRSQLTGLELHRMGGSVASFVNLYLPLLHRSGYVAPNLGDHGLSFDSPGGYVMSSKPGFYKNVLVLDFKSLYPSIMRTFCIDPLGLIEGLLNPKDAIPGYNNALFSRHKNHLPALIKTLSITRQEAKDSQKPMLSQAIKIIMNSLYGVLGSRGCRFYDPRLSSSITLRGHDIMQTTKKWIEECGYNVIYGDTDSIFITLDDGLNTLQCDEIGKQLAININQQWVQEISQKHDLESFLEIEFETLYSPFFMPTIRGKTMGSKKRYVGQKINKNHNELVFKGVEAVRSDWTEFAQEFQVELFEALFSSDYKISLLEELVNSYSRRLQNGEFDDKLIYRKRLGQNLTEYKKNIPPHVQAVKKYKAQNPNFEVKRGQIIEYVYTFDGPELSDTNKRLNYPLYIKKQLDPIAEMIFSAMEVTLSKSSQTSLF